MATIIFIFLFLISSCPSDCSNSIRKGNNFSRDTGDIQTQIEIIKHYCDKVENELQLFDIQVDINDLSTQGGDASVYFYKNEVVKIEITIYGEIGSRKLLAFYKDDMLIRVIDTMFKYSSIVYDHDNKVEDVECYDYFFSENKVISVLKENNIIEPEANYEAELNRILVLLMKIKSKT